MPTVLITCDADGVVVDVPFDVVPSKYIVPLPPLAAVMVVELQKVPAPVTVTVVGNGLITTTTLPCVPQHPDADCARK